MDITLERMLSLVDKKANGEFAHGALKKFANSIGLKSGNLISDWIAGRSESYKSKIYEVSEKYNVSVAWLLGESDTKEKDPAVSDEADEITKELYSIWSTASEEERAMLLDMARVIKSRRKKD